MRHTVWKWERENRAVIAIALKALFLRPSAMADSFVSLASGSRAHDVEQAITPQGQLWGVCF